MTSIGGGRRALRLREGDARQRAEGVLPAVDPGPAEHPVRWPRHPGLQPPRGDRLLLPPADDPPRGGLHGQVGLLHGNRHQGQGGRGLHAGRRDHPRGPLGREGLGGRTANRSQAARRGGVVRDLSRGTRSPDGRLYRGKTGVARLALESGAPVIPVTMIGTNIAQPIGRKIPKLHRIGVVVGEPLDFSRYAGMHGDRFVLRSITDEIMYELMRLSGQEYVDIYAATMKNRMAAAKKEAAKKEKDESVAKPPERVGTPGGLSLIHI